MAIRTPLNQEHYAMKIVKDLGMVATNSKPVRKAIFECSSCGAHEERIAQNSKKSLFCTTCQKREHARSLWKPLNQSDYKVRILEDKFIYPKPTEARRALVECTKCLKPFNMIVSTPMSKKQLLCGACHLEPTQNTSHPLYPIWNGIKQRCYSPKRKDYHRYGGIGVTMADEWKEDVNAFITWCEVNGWKPGLQVDKDIKCVEQNITPHIYSPETVTFVSASINVRAAVGRKVNQLTLTGEFIRSYDSAIEAGLDAGLKSGDPITNVCKGRAKTSAGYKWEYSHTEES